MTAMPFLQAGFNARHRDTGICAATRPIDGKRFAAARLIQFSAGDYAWRGERFVAWGEQVVVGTWEGLGVAGEFDQSEIDDRPRPGRRVALTIIGEAASKSNSRELVMRGRGPKARPMFIKSDKGLAYEADALLQIPPAARLRMEGPMRFTARIFYATERPDLDESLILDILADRYAKVGEGEKARRVLVQRGIYRNDRQVREKHVFHHIDRANPRAEIVVEPIEAPIFREAAA